MIKFLRKLLPDNFFLRVWWHRLSGLVAAVIYGFPARKLKVIGVTGTDGKTTVTLLTAHLLSQRFKVGMASSVYFQIGDRKWKNKTHKTTLGRFALQKLLKEMLQAGCEYVVLEASSIALHQGRLSGIPFWVALLTNLAPEHLAYHQTMERLAADKGRLFQKLGKSGVSILNRDNEYYEFFAKYPAHKKFSYSLVNETADFYVTELISSLQGTSFILHSPFGQQKMESPLLGDFNVANVLVATAAACSQGLSLPEIKEALKTFPGVPGRLELVNPGQDFAVFLDFALTPQAFEKLHRALRPLSKGKLIAVFGACGGGRDTWRRPVLGKLAAELCDFTILTDDEPYQDDPTQIINEIKAGLLAAGKVQGQDFVVIPDRREALAYAVSKAQAGDIITVTGLGDFETRMLAQGAVAWSDREEIKKAIGSKMTNK